jgi:hypothetical protein
VLGALEYIEWVGETFGAGSFRRYGEGGTGAHNELVYNTVGEIRKFGEVVRGIASG